MWMIVILAGWETQTQNHEKFTTLGINCEERKCQVLLAVITNGRCKILSMMCEQTAVDAAIQMAYETETSNYCSTL